MIIQGGVLGFRRRRPLISLGNRKNPHFKLGHHLIQLSIDQHNDCAKIYVFFVLDSKEIGCTCRVMEKTQIGITKRSVAAVLVTAAVVGVSALSMQTPANNRSSLARPLKSIQTDKAILFYANSGPSYPVSFVERVPSGTGESRASIENLKLIAAAF
jgi:hypothetical protein